MSKLEEKIEKYIKSAKDMGLDLSEDLITKVTKGLGPSIHNKDSEGVACTDKGEIDTVVQNFLKKKLGLTQSDDELTAAAKEVCEKLKVGSRHRALVYALLAKKFGKESVYNA